MKRWQKEMEDEFPNSDDPDQDSENNEIPPHYIPSFQPASRPVLGAVENSVTERQPPSTPSPISVGFRTLSPLSHRTALNKRHGFKSPLLLTATGNAKGATSYVASLDPDRPKKILQPIEPLRLSTPVAKASSPSKKNLGALPRRQIGGTPLKKPAFMTPFKAGMKPGEAGRKQLDGTRDNQQPASSIVFSASKSKGKSRAVYFDLSRFCKPCCSAMIYPTIPAKPSNRQTLATCGLRPQAHDQEELELMGM